MFNSNDKCDMRNAKCDMKYKTLLFVGVLIFFFLGQNILQAQERKDIFPLNNPSDPLQVRRHLELLFELYNFQESGRLSGTRFIYNQNIGKRHLLTADIPLLLTDYTGQDTHIGLGDLKIRYMFIANTNDGDGIYRTLALHLDVHTPTGNTEKGLGTGTFIFAPAVSTKLKFTNRLNLYPKVWYAFSFTEAAYIAAPIGSGILPNPDEEEDGKAKSSNLVIELPVVVEFINSAGWFEITPTYAYNFVTKKYTVNFSGELGWMMNYNWGTSFETFVYAWGEKTVSSVFSLNFYIYLK